MNEKTTWEEAIVTLRGQPEHSHLINSAYLGADLEENCDRFLNSAEFEEVLAYIKKLAPGARSVLDMPAGNGIASHALARAGYSVVAVDPDPSPSVGRGAIEFIKTKRSLSNLEVVDAYGESLPFEGAIFDIVYVRQGLHHARDLNRMLIELARVLRPGGWLIATREHVVDDYGKSLQSFLANQVDHQLYGGEHAFTLPDYTAAFRGAGLQMKRLLGPFDSIINLHPVTFDGLRKTVLDSRRGRFLTAFLPPDLVYRLALWKWKRSRFPGRLYSFIAQKG